MRYQHTQIGYVTLISLGLALFMSLIILSVQFSWIVVIVGTLLIISAVLFPSLTVTVTDDIIDILFGWGPIRFKVNLSDIESTQVVQNRWYYGWGIRFLGMGWLYNVSGLRAVELQMKNGRRHRIGTDEPEKLNEAIQEALGR